MPRAEAGISGGLPLFECSSFGVAPSKTCLQNKNWTIFWCFIFSLQPYFQGFVQSFKIYLSCALCTFDAHFCSVLTGQNWQPCHWGEGTLYAEFQFLRRDCKLSFLFTLLPWECLGRVCLQATEWNTVKSSLFVSHTCFMIKNSLNKFATHDFLIITLFSKWTRVSSTCFTLSYT